MKFFFSKVWWESRTQLTVWVKYFIWLNYHCLSSDNTTCCRVTKLLQPLEMFIDLLTLQSLLDIIPYDNYNSCRVERWVGLRWWSRLTASTFKSLNWFLQTSPCRWCQHLPVLSAWLPRAKQCQVCELRDRWHLAAVGSVFALWHGRSKLVPVWSDLSPSPRHLTLVIGGRGFIGKCAQHLIVIQAPGISQQSRNRIFCKHPAVSTADSMLCCAQTAAVCLRGHRSR